MAVSETPNLPSVPETLAPSGSMASLGEASHTLAQSDRLTPSPMPSPRPYTPQGRDWAAEDDDEDEGSLPSLDDWGFSGVKAASDAGDDAPAAKVPMAGMRKLSLSTDAQTVAKGRKGGSAPESSIEKSEGSNLPSFANIIPPTPVAVRPNQQNAFTAAVAKAVNSPLGPTLNRAGRSLARTSSPRPLNLVQERSPSPGVAALGSPSLLPVGSRPTSPRPMSGGVSLGVGSRSVSPAPGSGRFSPSPTPGSAFDINRSRPASPGFAAMGGPRPGSPAYLGGFAGSRPSSPRPGGGISGGVSLGVSRPSSPNPEGFRSSSPVPPPTSQSNLSISRPSDGEAARSWRSPLRKDASLPSPVEAPPSSTPNIAAAATAGPVGGPPIRGRGGFRGGFRGGMGRGDGGPSSHSSSHQARQFTPNQHQSPPPVGGANPTKTPHPPPLNTNTTSSPIRTGRGGYRGGHGRHDSETGSPQSARSSSSVSGRQRGHERTPSRPIIAAAALSRISASLSASPPKRRPAHPDPQVAGA